ncbi:MAG: glutathione peroxidase [Flavobacteriales bacterium]|nr:glutathione peroxidase [Flavobacteriales bacterium]
MKHLFLLPALMALMACGDYVTVGPVKVPTAQPATTPMPTASFHGLSATDIHGKPFSFDQLKGKKVLVVNTASECGYTPQYRQLQELYAAYKDKGLVVVGFPSNDFGGQEPGNEQQIEQFCQANYGVTFPMMSKVSTKGADQHPVYQWLTQKAQNGKMDSEVKWNFQKYLVDEQGQLVTMLASAADPLGPEVINWIEGRK